MRVAIVGAGVIGLYLAWKLSEKGEKVTVFEKRRVIGKSCCSGLFSERIFNFIPQSKKLIEKEINSLFVRFPKKTIAVEFKKRFFMMDHAKLDKLTAELAKKAGAEIRLNHQIKDCSGLFSRFDRVIGCDGALSEIRKSLGLKNPDLRLGAQKFVACPESANHIETQPFSGGFSWKIPRKDKIEYGIMVPFKKNKDMRALGYTDFAMIPQGIIIPKNDKVTLCGDAAGLAKPWSGGGVVWGLTAAEILLKNFPDLLKYQKAAKRFFLLQVFLSKIILKLVYFFGFNFPWVLPQKIKIDGDFLP